MPTHIVAVSGLITHADGDILMIKSPRRGWEMPGGQVEEGETLIEALEREIKEEAGVKVTVGQMVGVYSNVKPPTKVIFGFLCKYISGTPTTSAESLMTEWVEPTQAIRRVTHPAISDRLGDMLAFSGHVMYRVYTTLPYHVMHEQFI